MALQYVNKRLLQLTRDNTLWREQCFRDSSFTDAIRRRRELLSSEDVRDQHVRNLARALASGNGEADSRLRPSNSVDQDMKARANERIRIMANWDPSYPSEKVNWYDEYIARHAPISTSWLQQPRIQQGAERGFLEVRGFALYTPQGESDSTLVVGPLDDGSVCIWDISRACPKQGRIIARSKSGLLSVDPEPQNGANKRSKMLNTDVTECVSVDNMLRRAYFAVQSGMSNLSRKCYYVSMVHLLNANLDQAWWRLIWRLCL